MSCNTTEDVRIIMKYSTIAGATPTIPESDDHTDGTWLPTDLYIGEFFVNTLDNLVWIRTESGITPIGATSGTASFIGDYVHISGGTYSGKIYAPTISTADLVSVSINTSEITADYFYGGTFSGDGSLLTGIISEWLGGTISNPVYFLDEVQLTNDTYLDGPIYTHNDIIDINSDLSVSGSVTASIFYGDGSGLTNIPMGTYSDIYTISATLSGNEIVFTRNDDSEYSVDLSDILSPDGISDMYWDEEKSTLVTELKDGTFINVPIDTWNDIAALGNISAPTFYGDDFYGSFHGTFSDDIYTTDANLYNTNIVFDRTDGSTYSVDLSSLQFSGATGATGATGSFDAQFIDGWLNSASYSTQISALENNSNWNSDGVFIGEISGTYQGQRYYSEPYSYDAFDDNQWVRTQIGFNGYEYITENTTSKTINISTPTPNTLSGATGNSIQLSGDPESQSITMRNRWGNFEAGNYNETAVQFLQGTGFRVTDGDYISGDTNNMASLAIGIENMKGLHFDTQIDSDVASFHVQATFSSLSVPNYIEMNAPEFRVSSLSGNAGDIVAIGSDGRLVATSSLEYDYYTENKSLQTAKVQVLSTSGVNITQLWKGATGGEQIKTTIDDGLDKSSTITHTIDGININASDNNVLDEIILDPSGIVTNSGIKSTNVKDETQYSQLVSTYDNPGWSLYSGSNISGIMLDASGVNIQSENDDVLGSSNVSRTEILDRLYDKTTSTDITSLYHQNSGGDGQVTISAINTTGTRQDTFDINPVSGSKINSHSTSFPDEANISILPGSVQTSITDGTSTTTLTQTYESLEYVSDTNYLRFDRNGDIIMNSNGVVNISADYEATSPNIIIETDNISLQANGGSIFVQPSQILIAGTAAQYDNDYSEYYNDRSLVDKAYVDAHGGGPTPSLSDVLEVGELAGNHNIYFPNLKGIRNSSGVTSSTGLTFDSDSVTLFAGTGSIDDYGSRAIVAAAKSGDVSVQVENNVDFNMNLNGLGAGDFTIAGYTGFKGVQYTADYSADYTNRSLVDKEYVDNASGPTPSLSDVLLAGNNAGDTDIIIGAGHYINNHDSSATIRFTDDIRITNGDGFVNPRVHVDKTVVQVLNDDGSNTSNISVYETNLNISSDNGSTDTSSIYMDPATMAISVGDESYSAMTYSRIDFTPQTIWITNTSGQGVEYTADYSATFTNRSLVDKEYVDNAISVGTSGTSGVNGSSGTSGSSGVNGSSGTSGSSGVNGANGSSGTSGANGSSGTSGSSGINGANGSSGTSGSSGVNGANGSSGTSGINGANGSSGTSGSSGVNGANGSSGTSGANGSSGTSGTRGTSGTSGISGVNAGSFGITIDGGGSAITTGLKGYITIPYSGTITGWTIVSDVVGSCVIDVWKDTYANFPPSVTDSITGTDKPTLSSANKNKNTTLSGWIMFAVAAGDIVAFNVDSASTVTRVHLYIDITKTS